MHIGETNYSGGRAGDQPAVGMSASLEKYGLKLGRLKTGTPPRVNKRSIDYSQTEEQPGEPDQVFLLTMKNSAATPSFLSYHLYH